MDMRLSSIVHMLPFVTTARKEVPSRKLCVASALISRALLCCLMWVPCFLVSLRRYLNSAAAKALFRAGRIEDAEAMAAKFTKHGDQLNGLTEMQCMWYEIECGNAYIRQREYGKVQHFSSALWI